MQWDVEVGIAQHRDHLLKVVPLLACDTDLLTLNRRLNLELRVLDALHDRLALITIDALNDSITAPLLPPGSFNSSGLQAPCIDLSTDQFVAQDVFHLFELEFFFGA